MAAANIERRGVKLDQTCRVGLGVMFAEEISTGAIVGLNNACGPNTGEMER
jgi:hypothetical protein